MNVRLQTSPLSYQELATLRDISVGSSDSTVYTYVSVKALSSGLYLRVPAEPDTQRVGSAIYQDDESLAVLQLVTFFRLK